MGRFQARWCRFIIVWLVLSLLAGGGLADSIAEYISRVIEPIADATVRDSTLNVDRDLASAGFDAAKQRQVLDWRALSPVRKVETAYLSAERARAGSGEDFLAKLAKQLAMERPTLHNEAHLKPFLNRPIAAVTFASLHELPPDPPGDLHIKNAIRAITRHVDSSDLIFTEDLLRAGGLNEHEIYDVLRASHGPSRQQALTRAVASRSSATARNTMIHRMAQHLVDNGGATVSPEVEEIARRYRKPDPGPLDPSGIRPPTSPHDDGPSGAGNGGGGGPTGGGGGGGGSGGGGDSGRGPSGPGGLDRSTSSGADHPYRRQPPIDGLRLGGLKMEHSAAKPIHRQGVHAGGGRMRAALGNIRFGRGNGGVSFGEIASPAPGTRVSGLTLRYDAARPDGQRAVASIAGKNYVVPAPDWILLPAAAWSRDKDVEALTGFGRLEDASKQLGCELVFNYAPALNGTLMGLRLMQADIVTFPGYGDLFKLDGQYVLGADEVAPSADEIEERAEAQLALNIPPVESYILTDADRPITFTLSGDKVVFAGAPVYRLWKTAAADWRPWNDDTRGVSPAAIAKRAAAAEQTLLARLAGKPLELGFRTLTDVDVRARAKVARTLAATDDGKNALRVLEHWVRQTTVVVLPDRENPLSNPKTIEALNPTVYRAVTQFAQLAAFLRYVQANHPTAWATFMKQVPPATKAQPTVQLPTCIPAP